MRPRPARHRKTARGVRGCSCGDAIAFRSGAGCQTVRAVRLIADSPNVRTERLDGSRVTSVNRRRLLEDHLHRQQRDGIAEMSAARCGRPGAKTARALSNTPDQPTAPGTAQRRLSLRRSPTRSARACVRDSGAEHFSRRAWGEGGGKVAARRRPPRTSGAGCELCGASASRAAAYASTSAKAHCPRGEDSAGAAEPGQRLA
jgi:hypothetical protein